MTRVQLGPISGTDVWKKGSVDAMIITRMYGIEVPHDWVMPPVTYLSDTMPRFPRSHEGYYVEGGGSHWPFRAVFGDAT